MNFIRYAKFKRTDYIYKNCILIRIHIFCFITIFLLKNLICYSYSMNSNNDSIKNSLDEIIITATKTKRVLSSIPLNAAIIKKEEIEMTSATRLTDVINEEIGLMTVSDFGGGEGIQIQGLDSEYTLILVDNQPLIGRSAGTLDLNRISVGNIKQIEIVKGASSSLYGNEALAGIINIITEEPTIGFNTYISNSYETHNTIDTNVFLGYRTQKFTSSFFLNSYSSDGYDLDETDELKTVNKFKNITGQLKLGLYLSDNVKVGINFRHYDQVIDNIASNTLSGETFISENNISLKFNHEIKKFNNEFEIYFSSFYGDEFLNDQNGNRFSESYYDQIIIRPEIKSIYDISEKSNIIIGIGNMYESLNRTYFDIRPKQNSPFIYFQYDYKPIKKINLLFGGRYDSFNEYKSQISPKFSGIYEFDKYNHIKMSAGYGFKAPDFRQLYFNFTNSTIGYSVIGYNVVNDVMSQLIEEGQIVNLIVPIEEFDNSLSPESSFSLNIGFETSFLKNFKFSSNFFNNSTRNLIDYQVIANKTNGQNVFSYYNINEVTTYGVEVKTKYNPNNNFKISLGYQLLYAYDLDARKAFDNGQVFVRLTPLSPAFRLKKSDYFGLYNRSRHMAIFKINYINLENNFNSSIRLRYRSKYGLYDSNSNNYLDKYDEFVNGYITANISLNKMINQNISLSAGIENIFNYLDSQNILNLSGRIYFLRAKYNLK